MTAHILGRDGRSPSHPVDVPCQCCRKLVWLTIEELLAAQDLLLDTDVRCRSCAAEEAAVDLPDRVGVGAGR